MILVPIPPVRNERDLRPFLLHDRPQAVVQPVLRERVEFGQRKIEEARYVAESCRRRLSLPLRDHRLVVIVAWRHGPSQIGCGNVAASRSQEWDRPANAEDLVIRMRRDHEDARVRIHRYPPW